MRTLAHLSDLHFGRNNPIVTDGILRDIEETRPDLVVVSGDLTQRARRAEFAAARGFLDRIPRPLVVVPGNHDIPFYDVARRVLAPLARYRRYVSQEVAPAYADEELAVVGFNTAHPNTWKNGRLAPEEVARLCDRFAALGNGRFKVLVAHHPFIPPADDPSPAVVEGAPAALAALERAGAELVLSGHLHRGYSRDVREHHVTVQRAILAVHAGTATSTRLRGEPNSYNLLTVDRPRLTVDIRAWDGAAFRRTARSAFRELPGSGWEAAA